MSPPSVLGGGGPASVTASVTAPSTAAGEVAAGSTEQEDSGLNRKLDQSGGKQERSKNIAAAQEGQQSQLGPDGQDLHHRCLSCSHILTPSTCSFFSLKQISAGCIR